MLTIAQHIALMRHALGKTPATGHDLYQSFNDAGNYLVNYCRWSWLLTKASLTTVAANELVPVPIDYQEFVSLTMDGDPIDLVDLPFIHRARAGDLTLATGQLVCIPPILTHHATTGAVTAKSAILWPIPTTNGLPAMELWYWRGWTDVTSADDAKYPRISPECEQALKMLARDAAIVIENQTGSLEGSLANALLQELEARDGEKQTHGRPRGGASSRRRTAFRRDQDFDFTL